MPTHKLMGGKLNLYKRENSRFWQCSTFLEGRNRRISTKEESLAQAKELGLPEENCLMVICSSISF